MAATSAGPEAAKPEPVSHTVMSISAQCACRCGEGLSAEMQGGQHPWAPVGSLAGSPQGFGVCRSR